MNTTTHDTQQDTTDGTLEQLSRPFPIEIIEERNGFFYVPIEAYIRRLNEVCGLEGWKLSIDAQPLQVIDASTNLYGTWNRQTDEKESKTAFMAQATATLTIRVPAEHLGGLDIEITRDGVGADIGTDPDKVIKTAQANALKKAANQFGIAGELFNEEYRKELKKRRQQLANLELKIGLIEAYTEGQLKRNALAAAREWANPTDGHVEPEALVRGWLADLGVDEAFEIELTTDVLRAALIQHTREQWEARHVA